MNLRAKPYSGITWRDRFSWKGSIQSLHCWLYKGVKTVTLWPGNDLTSHLSSDQQEVSPWIEWSQYDVRNPRTSHSKDVQVQVQGGRKEEGHFSKENQSELGIFSGFSGCLWNKSNIFVTRLLQRTTLAVLCIHNNSLPHCGYAKCSSSGAPTTHWNHSMTSASAQHGLLCQLRIPGVPKPARTAVLTTHIHIFWPSGSFPSYVNGMTPHLCKWPGPVTRTCNKKFQRYLGTGLLCPWTGLGMGRSGRGVWVAPGRCRVPTPVWALPAGLVLNPARLLQADQKEFFLLCMIYLGKTRWLVLESPFQVRSRARSQRCAVKEKPPFVQKLPALPPTPHPPAGSTACVWAQAGTSWGHLSATDSQGTAQHQHCMENLPIPGHCKQKPWTSIWQSLRTAILTITALQPPERGWGREGTGKPAANRAVGT